MKIRFLLLASTVILLSCKNPTAVTPGTQNNVITGIKITSEISPEVIAVWGNPNTNYPDPPDVEPPDRNCDLEECESLPEVYRLDVPYPNPSDGGGTNIPFSLPISSEVTVWMESGYWPGEDAILPFRNPTSSKPAQRIIFIDGMILQAGYHQVTMGANTTCFGGEVAPGFYRVFIKAGDFFQWQDVYLFGPKNTNPPGLDDLMFGECFDKTENFENYNHQKYEKNNRTLVSSYSTSGSGQCPKFRF
jgi:hypothetical protein